MQQNILRTSEVAKIFFIYNDGRGLKKKQLVKLQYMDTKRCYFCLKNVKDFNKPKWRTKADIFVYTSDGIYHSQQIIRDASYTHGDILFEVDLPKTWNFKQMRAGTRKKISLPVTIKFTDEAILNSTTLDLSIGGFSFETNQILSNVHKALPASCKLEFPKDLIVNFPDATLETEIKFVRSKAIVDEYEKEGWHLYSFKFTKLSPDELMVLKTFLMKII